MATKMASELYAYELGGGTNSASPTTSIVDGTAYYRMVTVGRVGDFNCSTTYTGDNRVCAVTSLSKVDGDERTVLTITNNTISLDYTSGQSSITVSVDVETSASPHVNKEVQLQIEYSYVNSDGTYTGTKTSSGRISLNDDEELTTYSIMVPTDTTYFEVTDIYVTPTDVAEELDEYKIIYVNAYDSTTIRYDYDGDHDIDYYDDDQLIYYNIIISGFSTFDDDVVTVSLFTTDGQTGKSKRVNITGNGTYSGWFGIADDEYDSYCSNGSYTLGFNLTELGYSGTVRIYDETNDDPSSIGHVIQDAYYMTNPSGGTLVALYCVYDTYNYDWMD